MCLVNSGDDVSSRESRDSEGTMLESPLLHCPNFQCRDQKRRKLGSCAVPVLHLATKMGEGGEACSEVRHVLHKGAFLTNVFLTEVFGFRLTLQEMVR